MNRERGLVDVTWMHDASAPSDAHELALRWMQPDERERHERFAFEHSRVQHRLARWLVRTTLSQWAPVDPADWRFVANEHGRPGITHPVEYGHLRFSLTHTPGLLAIAVSAEREVGLDAETVERINRTDDIAHRFFAPAEVQALRALADPAERRERFFTYWTLKESYIKARGMGLALPLDAFAFDVEGAEPRIAFDARLADDPARWRFFRHRPTAIHRLALAVNVGPAEPLLVRVRGL